MIAQINSEEFDDGLGVALPYQGWHIEREEGRLDESAVLQLLKSRELKIKTKLDVNDLIADYWELAANKNAEAIAWLLSGIPEELYNKAE